MPFDLTRYALTTRTTKVLRNFTLLFRDSDVIHSNDSYRERNKFSSLDCIIGLLEAPPCNEIGTSLSETPSKLQFTILYVGLAIASIGLEGARYTVATMGANQFDKP
ncbi:hypothetical protein QYF36_016387 [Acer negundo]|nr:hypothetical protein QYF36_016387 [Acer negundo]